MCPKFCIEGERERKRIRENKSQRAVSVLAESAVTLTTFGYRRRPRGPMAFHGHVLGRDCCMRALLATRVTYAAADGGREGASSDVGVRRSFFFWGVTSGARPVGPKKEGRPRRRMARRCRSPRTSPVTDRLVSASLIPPVTAPRLRRRKCGALWRLLLPLLLDVITSPLPCDVPTPRCSYRMTAPTRRTAQGPALCTFRREVSLRWMLFFF